MMERVKISVILTVVFALSWRVRAAALTTWPSRLLLQKKIPLRLEHCRPLGYHETSKVNFVKGSSVDAEKNAFYWVLVSMKRLGCSELTNGYICSIFAPVFFTQYGTALPPCRSLCMKTRKACWNPIMAYMFLKSPFPCNHFPEPSNKSGCISFKYDDDLAMMVMTVEGNPHAAVEYLQLPEY